MFAVFGILVQSAVLITSALVVYSWKWQKGTHPVPSYGYPCFVVGTTGFTAGIILCSHVIEGSTNEQIFKPNPVHQKNIDKFRVIRLQQECVVSEQHFDSYCISNAEDDPNFLLEPEKT